VGFNNIAVLLGGNNTHAKMTADIVVGQLKQLWEAMIILLLC